MLNLRSNKKFFVVFALLCLCVNLFVIWHLFGLRNGFHVDEIWSYAHSNSNNGPMIFGEKNQASWLPQEIFHDYLTVQKSDGFNFRHIYENVKDDVHTPLYYMLFYTVNYFFDDAFSLWTGAGLNMGLWMLSLMVMYTLSLKIFSNPFLALAPVVLYAFSIIGVSTVLFIRLYLLLTLILLCFVNASFSYMKEKEKYAHTAFKMFLFSFLAMLTSYTAIVFVFFFSLVFGCVLLFEKEYKKLAGLAVALFAGFAFFVAVWPYGILKIIEYNPVSFHENKDVLDVLEDIFSIYFLQLLGFRKDIHAHINIGYFCFYAVCFCYAFALNFYLGTFQRHKFVFFISAVVFLTHIWLTFFMPDMFIYSGRYVMFLYPYIAIITIFLIYQIAVHFLPEKMSTLAMYGIVVLSICFVDYLRYCPYIFHQDEGEQKLMRELEGKNLVALARTQYVLCDASDVYLKAENVYLLPPYLYRYVTECDPANDMSEWPKIYADLKKGDYLLIFDQTFKGYFFDNNTPKRSPIKVCEDFESDLRFVDVIRIGNFYVDVYRIEK